MCHDLIPDMFPTWYPERDTMLFRRHWTAMFPTADSILVSSRTVAADIRAFCGKAAIGLGRIAPVRPGYDPMRTDPAFALPSGLEPGKYALFVGTIEPRKGHAMLLDVWRRLLAEGLPQRRRFKLVFVDRPGWQVENVLRQIADGAAFQGTLRHFAGVDDATLAGLYRDAAFCLYPSIYEGFGLPVIEALAHGKAVIVSTGGAVPEAVGALSPCLPASDSQARLTTLRRWIEEPNARAPYEKKISETFAHPIWDEAAAKVFEAALIDR